MFRSEYSGKQYQPGVKPVLVVVKARPQTYVNYVGEDCDEEKITHCWEIAREIRVGPDEVALVEVADVSNIRAAPVPAAR